MTEVGAADRTARRGGNAIEFRVDDSRPLALPPSAATSLAQIIRAYVEKHLRTQDVLDVATLSTDDPGVAA